MRLFSASDVLLEEYGQVTSMKPQNGDQVRTMSITMTMHTVRGGVNGGVSRHKQTHVIGEMKIILQLGDTRPTNAMLTPDSIPL